MTSSLIPPALVLPPLIGALLVAVFALHAPRRARVLVVLAQAISVLAAVAALWHCVHGEVLEYAFGGWLAPYGIVYRIDGLSAVMALLIAAIGLAVFIYAGPSVSAELPGDEPAFLATASLLVGALLGMAVTGDLFNLYVFLEIASISAYSLIASGGGAAALASFRYLLFGTVGASLYLLGLAYIFSLTGTLNMADMAVRLPAVGDLPALRIALALMITGFTLKMALFPMHAWLPDAYTYAPSAASALIAAVMTKVNAFALLRILYSVFWPAVGPLDLPLTPILGWLAAAAILFGSIMALAQTDLKRLLAYSSVSQLGYITLGLALGTELGLIGAMLHIVAHAMTKGCLFLIAGAVAYRHGSRRITAWRGLHHSMPLSMAAFVVAALSLIGIPPTAGFFSKWYLLVGSLDAGQVGFAVVLLISSLLNAWYFFRLIEMIYFNPPAAEGEPKAEPKAEPEGERSFPGRELPRAMLGPIVAAAAAIIVVGVLSHALVRNVLADAVAALPGRGQVTVVQSVEPGVGDAGY